MKIFIKKDSNYYRPILYTMLLIENNQSLSIEIVDHPNQAEIIFDHTNSKSQVIASSFYNQIALKEAKFSFHLLFKQSQVICNDQESEDLIATIFYMVNCLQEHQPSATDIDQYGRFKFQSSYQFEYDSIEKNLVQEYIERWLNKNQHTVNDQKSEVFISHDIDILHTAILPLSSKVIRNFSPFVLLKILFNKILRKPNLESLDQILKINSEYDIRSTFFWLLSKQMGKYHIPNADYKFDPEYCNRIRTGGGINALHKSSQDTTLDQEIAQGEFDVLANRYHYLAHLPHQDWKMLSASQIMLDASLAFAEHMGFRNSYGQAFQPFDIETQRPFDFVEVPLHIMDTTFERYLQTDPKLIASSVINFIEKNKMNCTLSILWHNQHFNKYDFGPYLKAYKQILVYIYENQFNSLTPQEIMAKRKLKWPDK